MRITSKKDTMSVANDLQISSIRLHGIENNKNEPNKELAEKIMSYYGSDNFNKSIELMIDEDEEDTW